MHLSRGVAAIALIALGACGGEGAPVEAGEGPVAGSEIDVTASEDVAAEPAAAPVEPKPSPLADLPEPYASADYDRGRRLFMQCQSCHTLNEGGPSLAGPNLHGVFGRTAGAHEGFAYSDALKEAGFSWSPEQLDAWLAKPRTFLPGNRMMFSAISDASDRTAVIAYLMVETD